MSTLKSICGFPPNSDDNWPTLLDELRDFYALPTANFTKIEDCFINNKNQGKISYKAYATQNDNSCYLPPPMEHKYKHNIIFKFQTSKKVFVIWKDVFGDARLDIYPRMDIESFLPDKSKLLTSSYKIDKDLDTSSSERPDEFKPLPRNMERTTTSMPTKVNIDGIDYIITTTTTIKKCSCEQSNVA